MLDRLRKWKKNRLKGDGVFPKGVSGRKRRSPFSYLLVGQLHYPTRATEIGSRPSDTIPLPLVNTPNGRYES